MNFNVFKSDSNKFRLCPSALNVGFLFVLYCQETHYYCSPASCLYLKTECSVPFRYMKGRVSYDQLNAAVQSINTAVTAKYKILQQSAKTLNNNTRKLYQRFKDQETKDTKGMLTKGFAATSLMCLLHIEDDDQYFWISKEMISFHTSMCLVIIICIIMMVVVSFMSPCVNIKIFVYFEYLTINFFSGNFKTLLTCSM